MNEKEAKFAFISYLQKNNLAVSSDRTFSHSKPDVVFKKENFWYCAEVKGNDSVLSMALGDVISCFRDFSHVYICGPVLFLDAFVEMLKNNPELDELKKKMGIILIEENRVVFFQEAKNSVYYYHAHAFLRRKHENPLFPDDKDMRILGFAKDKPIFSSDAKHFGLRPQAFYKRLLGLEKQGYLRRAAMKTNPVPFVRTEKEMLIF